MTEISSLEETEIQEHPQVKEEQVDQCISPGKEAETSNNAEVTDIKSEPATNSEQLASSTAETVSASESIEDGSSSPGQSQGIEVFVELEQPSRGDKSCRFCGKTFRKDSFLIRHVAKSHKKHKAFKCLECKKEFEQRSHLIQHTRVHTGEKPYSCDFCDKTFTQNSSRLVHMRVHTGEKPYFCNNCGRSFATSKHLRFCKMQNEGKVPPAKGSNRDEDHKEEKAFKCSECNKEFKRQDHLVLHMRVHTGEKPYSCDFCGKTFSQNSSRTVHMRVHTGEKPYLCNKCGKSFTYSKHAKFCTGIQNKGKSKSIRCTTCGKTFYTDSDLEVHMEVHESWKRHITEKTQEPERERKKLKNV